MKTPEKRLLARLPLGQVPRGTLKLQCMGGLFPILDLKDMSDTGISFTLNEHVPMQNRIALQYADEKMQLEVFGRVVWCKEVRELALTSPLLGKYLLGVELLSPMMLYAVLPKC